MQISLNSNSYIFATIVLNFNMKTVSETFESLLFDQNITYFEFLHMQILCKLANFMMLRLAI